MALILGIFCVLCFVGYYNILNNVFTKHPPLTPEEEAKQKRRMEAERQKNKQVLKDTMKDVTFGATMVGLGLLDAATKPDEKKKK